MRNLFLFLLIVCCTTCGHYAGYKGLSEEEAQKDNPEYANTLRMRDKLKNAPSNLVITANLDDASSLLPNNRLDGEESAKLIVTITNSERGINRDVGRGFDVVCGATCNNRDIMINQNQQRLGDIDPNLSATAIFSISVSPKAVDGYAVFEIYAKESRPYEAQPVRISIPVYHLDKPRIEWTYPLDHRIEVTQDFVRISAIVTSESEIIETLVRVNGVIVNQNGNPISSNGRGGAKVVSRKEKMARFVGYPIEAVIPLNPLEDGRITIRARNTSTSTISDERIVYYKIPKHDLHLLSIGISDYENDKWDLDFADDDARAISRIFSTQQGKLFNNVTIRSLYNSDATRQNILSGLRWLESIAKPNDLTMLFIAAHGKVDFMDNFYIMPFDGDFDRSMFGIDLNDMKVMLRRIQELPSTVLLFMDTCHSGHATRGSNPINEAIRDLALAEREMIVMSATSEKGTSVEKSELGHGAFTMALIEGLEKGLADYSNSGVIYLHGLNTYVTDRVMELTDHGQKPEMKKSIVLPLFQWK